MLSGGDIFSILVTDLQNWKNIMYLTPFSYKQVMLIFLILPQITQVIPAVTSSPLAFLFNLHYTTIPRFDWKRYQMVFASIIWRHAAAVHNIKYWWKKKITIFPPATTFFFWINKLKLTFPQITDVDFTECSRSHSCDQCTRSERKNVVHYK